MIRDRKLKVYGVQTERKDCNSMFAATRRWLEVPQIKLQGLWLKEIGFKPGESITIQCEKGKLIITHSEEGV